MSISFVKKAVVLSAMAMSFAALPSIADSESGGFVWMGDQGESGGVYNSGGMNANSSLWGLGNNSESGGVMGNGASSESGGVVYSHSESGNSRENDSLSRLNTMGLDENKVYVKSYHW